MVTDSMHGVCLAFNHHSKEHCNFEVVRVSNIEKTETFFDTSFTISDRTEARIKMDYPNCFLSTFKVTIISV